MRLFTRILLVFALFPLFSATTPGGGPEKLYPRIDQMARDVNADVIALRRHFHEHPELSNREFKTAERVAEELKQLGLEVRTEVAHTGVVADLKGGRPGRMVALRADMDALPVEERTDLPFASSAKGQLNGQEVPVMHACGHDAHVAILLGVARMAVDFLYHNN